MKISLISLAHRPPAWAQEAADDLTKRFPRDWPLHCIDLKPEARNVGRTVEQILTVERERILTALPKGARVVVFDERGLDLTSHALSKKLGQWHDAGEHLCLLIGSADGLHADIKTLASEQWKLSSLTLPHALARVLAIEALYRAWSIRAGHPYHRD